MRLLLLLLLCLAPLAHAAGPTAATLPAQPLIERTAATRNTSNFDLMFQNDSDAALELAGLEVTLFDRAGTLLLATPRWTATATARR